MKHYQTLQVDSRATKDVINAAHKALVKKYINDTEKLTAINLAYEIIGNDKKRKEYDREKDDHSGKVIGQYRILKLIAEGGFGKTYLGEHLLTKAPVCIKHANQVSSLDEQLMIDEANSIWDLRHFAIPAIRDVIKLPDGSLCLVMSYIPGPTLQQFIEKHKKLDPIHVGWIMDRLLNALRYLHLHGVVHGDVKPHNIIIQPEKHQIVLVDYGLSMVRPESENNKGYTPYYAAPEQINGGTLLPETDFYGLGMSMVFALGGNIENKSIPASVPVPLHNLLKRFVAFDLLSRPNWDKEDLCETIQGVREKSFGSKYSNMKQLVY